MTKEKITPYQAKKDLDYITSISDICGLVDEEDLLLKVLRKEVEITDAIIIIIKAWLASTTISEQADDELIKIWNCVNDIIKENHWTVLNFQRLSYLESGDFRGYARLSRADLFPCHVCLRHRRDMVPILLWMGLCDWHLGFFYLPFPPPYWPHLLQREVLPRRRLEGWAAQSKSSRSRRKSETPALR